MKLERITPATRQLPSSTPSAQVNEAMPPLRVGEVSALAADRERSLQQELDTIEALAIGDFNGKAQVLEDAHALATEIVGLKAAGGDPNRLIKTKSLHPLLFLHVDEAV